MDKQIHELMSPAFEKENGDAKSHTIALIIIESSEFSDHVKTPAPKSHNDCLGQGWLCLQHRRDGGQFDSFCFL